MSDLLLNAGITSHGVSNVLAAILAASSRPATEVLERLSGQPLAIRVLASGERPLADRERHRLGAEGIASCCYRTGLLVTADGTVAAGVFLLWLPCRLPFAACRELREGAQPAGRILGPLGMRREDRRALATTGIEEITGNDAAVRSSAVLVVGGQAVGMAEENVTMAFAASLA